MRKITLIILILAAFIEIGCSESDDILDTQIQSTVDVYVAGQN
jgi:uncharacterized protein YcfL